MKTLEQLYRDHDGKVSDKWSLYLTEYERFLAPYRDRPIRILEIGVQNGGSLEIWGKYFEEAEKIVGCDLNPDCAGLQYDDARISVVIGNANAGKTRRQILKCSSSYDIIIDDGSHRSKDVIRSFDAYFPCLSEGGLYVVEDLHCSYWEEFSGGLYHPGSSIAFFKLLVDIVNREHWGVDKARTELLHTFESCYGARTAEDLLRKIHSIEFINSLCAIRKCNDQNNLLGARAVAGVYETIAPMRAANGAACPQVDQRGNGWAVFRQINEEELLRSEMAAQSKLAERDAALGEIKTRLEAVGAELIAAKAETVTKEQMGAVQRNALEVQLAESGRQLRSIAEQLAVAKTERSSLEAALADARQQIQISAIRLAATKTERDSLESTLSDARQQIQFSAAQIEAAKAERGSAEAALADARQQIQIRATQLAATKTERDSLDSALSDARQQIQFNAAQLAAAKSEHQADVRDFRRDQASIAMQLDAAKAELAAAEAQLAESTAELARQRDDAARQCAELEAQRAALQERAAAAEARRENLQAEHDAVLNSTFWRVTAPARRLGAVLPRGVRRQTRRGARLLYWVLTPHRLATRIAHRRSRRESIEKNNAPPWAELFDRDWYLERYPEVAAGADKGDPLRHFIHHGAAERRDPNPFFDTSWYLESNPDVARAGDNALAHYFEHGAAEGRDPSPLFDTSWYLEVHGDVAEAGTNPLLHYLRHGAAEGRATRAVEPPALVTSPPATIARISLADYPEHAPAVTEKKAPAWAEFFDPNWYLEHYPDVAKADVNPLNHFENYGAAEGRNPNPAFDTAWYLSQYRDVAKAGLTAIDHFVEWGAAEGRRPISTFNYDYYRKQAGIRQASNLDAYRHYLTTGRAAGLLAYGPPTAVQLVRNRFAALEPLRVYEAPHRRQRVTIVTDSINAGSLYGGVATAIILSVLMARRLSSDLRLVTRTEPADATNIAMVLRTHGVHWAGNVECVYSPPGQGGQEIPISRGDFFLTTSWWGTHATRGAVPADRIFYMLGEDERLFYPTGDDYLLCGETLSDPEIFYAVNSQVLFEHLKANGLAPGGVAFEPAFPSTAYYPEERIVSERRQFFFYGRPNNLRNLYWRGISAIANAMEEGIFEPEKWDFAFLGKDMDEILLPGGVRPRIMNDAPREDYLKLIRRTDVGLSLIYTPHPSYPPFDLAACGAVVVTNRFSSKIDLSRYSPNILCVEPNLPGLIAGLRSAVALADDRNKCVANTGRFAMPRDWESALRPVLDRIAERCLGR